MSSKQAKQDSQPKATYGELLQYVKPYRWVLLLAFIGAIVDASMQAGFAAMLSPILDNGFVEQDPEWIRMIPFLIVGMFLIRAFGNFIKQLFLAHLGRSQRWLCRSHNHRRDFGCGGFGLGGCGRRNCG